MKSTKRKGPSLIQQAHLKHLLGEGYTAKEHLTPALSTGKLEIRTPLKFTSTVTFESTSPYGAHSRFLGDCASGSPAVLR